MEVPAAMARLPQWIVWRDEAGRKIPYKFNGTAGKSNDSNTWTSLDIASAAAPQFSGLGFVFAPDDGIFGVDLDGCRDPETKAISEWAATIIAEFNTYAEVSPSGTGVKIYGLGELPDGKGKRKVIDAPKACDKQPGIELYDRGRYFAFTGDKLPGSPDDLSDCQSALDLLLARLFPPAVAMPMPSRNGSDVESRARAYLREVTPAVSGQRGHDVTFRAACALVIGFSLPAEKAFPLLQEWSQSCVPPWSEKELWHKLHSADKQDGPRGLLAEDRLQVLPGVDLSGILDSHQEDEPEDDGDEVEDDEIGGDDVGAFPSECLNPGGLLGDIIDYTLLTSRYDQPEMALAGALALLSTITGRKIADTFGTRTNAYYLSLGLSGVGKEQARKTNKRLLLLAGAGHMLGSERIASHAGIVSAIHDQPAHLMQLDEIGRLLETMKDPRRAPHLYNCITVLMQLYSSSDSIWKADAYADLKKVKVVDQPHLCIYGTTTPETFWSSLSTSNIGEGLMGRLLVFEGRGYETMPKRPIDCDPSAELVDHVRYWIDLKTGGNLASEHPQPTRVPHTSEAIDRCEDHQKKVCERRIEENHLRAAVWSRNAERVNKLALLHACSRSKCVPESIRIEDVNYGIKVSNWLTRRLLVGCSDNVSENEVEAKSKRVLSIIRQASSGLSLNQLTRKTQWLKGRERQEIIADLVGAGFAKITEIPTGKRPRSVIETVKRQVEYRRPRKNVFDV